MTSVHSMDPLPRSPTQQTLQLSPKQEVRVSLCVFVIQYVCVCCDLGTLAHHSEYIPICAAASEST